jgi:hypothetical protein
MRVESMRGPRRESRSKRSSTRRGRDDSHEKQRRARRSNRESVRWDRAIGGIPHRRAKRPGGISGPAPSRGMGIRPAHHAGGGIRQGRCARARGEDHRHENRVLLDQSSHPGLPAHVGARACMDDPKRLRRKGIGGSVAARLHRRASCFAASVRFLPIDKLSARSHRGGVASSRTTRWRQVGVHSFAICWFRTQPTPSFPNGRRPQRTPTISASQLVS